MCLCSMSGSYFRLCRCFLCWAGHAGSRGIRCACANQPDQGQFRGWPVFVESGQQVENKCQAHVIVLADKETRNLKTGGEPNIQCRQQCEIFPCLSRLVSVRSQRQQWQDEPHCLDCESLGVDPLSISAPLDPLLGTLRVLDFLAPEASLQRS